MRYYLRLALITVTGVASLWLLWLGSGLFLRTPVPEFDAKRGVVDFLPVFRQKGVVDEALEKSLYDSLTELELTLRPYDAVNEWPRLIWQTSPTTGDTEEMKTWKVMNPDWRYKHYNDAEADSLIEGLYGSIPQIIHVYRTFPLGVLRADLFRYLILFAYGGIYADADVKCAKPIVSCVSPDFWADSTISLIVGVEIDEPTATRAVQQEWKWSRNHGFTQWTIAAKPFTEALKLAVVRSISHTYALARMRGVSDPGQLRSGRGLLDSLFGAYTVKDILEITGPGMWTDAVMDGMNANAKNRGGNTSQGVSWTMFTGLQRPKLVEQTLVLPVNYFGSGQRHSGAGAFDVPEACVNHLARRTWKTAALS